MSERDEWVPSFYDGYETRWSDEDQCYLARCAPEYGLLAFIMGDGDTREAAVRMLAEMLPDVACMNHKTMDEWVQRARKAEAEIEALREALEEAPIERGEGFTAHPVEKVVIAVFWPVFAVLVFVEWL